MGKRLSVCTSSVLNLRWPGVPRSTLFFLSWAGYADPQLINPMYFYLGYAVLLYFAFILFPWWFSHCLARETGGWLLTLAYPTFCFYSRRYADLATSFFISFWRAFCVHLRTKEKTIVKQQNMVSILMRPPPIPLIHSIGLSELRPSVIPWSVSVSGNSLREACYFSMILVCSLLTSRVRLSAAWPCKCHLTFFQVCSDCLNFWGVTQKVVMFQSHFKCICNLRFLYFFS